MKEIYALLILHQLKKPITEEALIAMLNAAETDHDPVIVQKLARAAEEMDIAGILKRGFTQVIEEVIAEEEAIEAPEEEEEDEPRGLFDLFG